jgi:hypothetical protein
MAFADSTNTKTLVQVIARTIASAYCARLLRREARSSS